MPSATAFFKKTLNCSFDSVEIGVASDPDNSREPDNDLPRTEQVMTDKSPRHPYVHKVEISFLTDVPVEDCS